MSRVLLLLLAACGDPGACELAQEQEACELGDDALTSCSFGAAKATGPGECRTLQYLHETLCDRGEGATREKIEEDTVCAPDACVSDRDGCEGCSPRCALESQEHSKLCDDEACTGDPLAGCDWNGETCQFAQ